MSQNTFSKVTPTATVPQTVNCRDAEECEVQITGLGSGDTIAVSRSLTGETFDAWGMYDTDLAFITSFTAPGIYMVEGGGYLKFSKTGSASTADIYVRQLLNYAQGGCTTVASSGLHTPQSRIARSRPGRSF